MLVIQVIAVWNGLGESSSNEIREGVTQSNEESDVHDSFVSNGGKMLPQIMQTQETSLKS